MEQLTIKRESLADRCEICHQADCYDPINNSCQRCSREVVIAAQSALNQRNYERPAERRPAQSQPSNLVITSTVALLGFCIGLISPIFFTFVLFIWLGSCIFGSIYICSLSRHRRLLNCAVLHAAKLAGALFLLSPFVSSRSYLQSFDFWTGVLFIWFLGMIISLLVIAIYAIFADRDDPVHLDLPQTPHRYLKR